MVWSRLKLFLYATQIVKLARFLHNQDFYTPLLTAMIPTWVFEV